MKLAKGVTQTNFKYAPVEYSGVLLWVLVGVLFYNNHPSTVHRLLFFTSQLDVSLHFLSFDH